MTILGGLGSVTFASAALPTFLEWELVWGTIFSLGAFAEGVGNILNPQLFTTDLLPIGSFTPQNMQ